MSEKPTLRDAIQAELMAFWSPRRAYDSLLDAAVAGATAYLSVVSEQEVEAAALLADARSALHFHTRYERYEMIERIDKYVASRGVLVEQERTT